MKGQNFPTYGFVFVSSVSWCIRRRMYQVVYILHKKLKAPSASAWNVKINERDQEFADNSSSNLPVVLSKRKKCYFHYFWWITFRGMGCTCIRPNMEPRRACENLEEIIVALEELTRVFLGPCVVGVGVPVNVKCNEFENAFAASFVSAALNLGLLCLSLILNHEFSVFASPMLVLWMSWTRKFI